MGAFWKCVLVKFLLNEFVLTKDLVYTACRRNVPQSHKYGGPPMNLELGNYNSTGWLKKNPNIAN